MCPDSVPELGKSPECGQSFGQTFSKDDEGRGTKQRVLFWIQYLLKDEEKAHPVYVMGSYFLVSYYWATENTQQAIGSWQ